MTSTNSTKYAERAQVTASLQTAEQRLKREQAQKTIQRITKDKDLGRLSPTEAMTLELIVTHLLDNSDGQFAQSLVALVQGEL